jgi:nitroreductase
MNQALQDVIEHRRTTNVFEPNHTISDEQIEHLVHLATRAPTSFNLQNWRFLAMRTPERKAKLRKLAYDQAKAKVSEAAVMVAMDSKARASLRGQL